MGFLDAAFLGRPDDLRCLGPSLLCGATEPVLGALGRDAAYGFSDLAPTGTGSPARFGRLLTQPVCGASKLICELQCGQCGIRLTREAGDDFLAPALDQPGDQRLRFGNHAASLLSPTAYFNYVLTTIC